MDSYYRESISFDAKLSDSTGRVVSVDCNLRLPAVWGEKVEISIGVPHSEMPISIFENPCELCTLHETSVFRVELNEVYYRYLPTGTYQTRRFGTSSIMLTHVDHLKIVDQSPTAESRLYICITSADYLSDETSIDSRGMLEELTSFHCSTLGEIKLQRYWTKSRLNSSNDFVLKCGYWLEVPADRHNYDVDQILNLVSPILDVLSILFRQRVAVVGWQLLQAGVRTRFWAYPVETLETSYVGLEPNRYIVSMEELSGKVDKAIDAYRQLKDREQRWVFFLSYSLSPAIQLRDAERFMSLFRVLESIASRSSEPKVLTEADQIAVKKLEDLASSMQEMSSEVSGRVKGFARKFASGELSLTGKINNFLNANDVAFEDLWGIDGDRGLIGIRNKLAHGGAHHIHHQGLAVATFHLSVLAERVVCSFLGVAWRESHHRIGREEWLDKGYVHALQKEVFDAKDVYGGGRGGA